MRTYIADIIPRIQRFSKRLDDLTKLTNQHWVSLGDINQAKRVYIFRPNNQLLISENGRVEKGSWEYLGNQSLLLETKEESYLLKHGFFDENVIALKLDSTDSYAFFINETKYHNELNCIADILKFLEDKYIQGSDNLDDLNLGKRGSIDKNISYTIISENDSHSILLGHNRVYNINFSNGISGKVYLNKSKRKFYYFDMSILDKIYSRDFEGAVKALFNYLTEKNNR